MLKNMQVSFVKISHFLFVLLFFIYRLEFSNYGPRKGKTRRGSWSNLQLHCLTIFNINNIMSQLVCSPQSKKVKVSDDSWISRLLVGNV